MDEIAIPEASLVPSMPSCLAPLLLLFLREEGGGGDELARRTEISGFGETRSEALYWVLGQMEREGMMLSERNGSGHGLPRRWHSITASGEAYLKTWAGSLARYGEVVDLPLAFMRGPRARPEARREVKTQVSCEIGRG